MSPHYLVKRRTSIHWLFVTGILLRNFVFKQLRCELQISKSMDFYCFLNFFTPKLYRFPHKKMNSTSCSENLSQQRLRTLKATWPIRFRQLLRALVMISAAFWHLFVLLKDSQNTRKRMSDILEKSLLGISEGGTVTYFRWGGQIYNLLV